MSGAHETRTRDLCRDSGPVIGFTTYKIARTAKGPPKLFKIAQDTALCGLRIQPFSTIDIRRHAGNYAKKRIVTLFRARSALIIEPPGSFRSIERFDRSKKQ